MSVPEPPPKLQGVVVPDALIQYLEKDYPFDSQHLRDLIRERDAYGRAKYGQPLMSQDGRDGVEDARQEAGDLLQYAFKVYLSGDTEGVRQLSELAYDIYHVLDTLPALNATIERK